MVVPPSDPTVLKLQSDPYNDLHAWSQAGGAQRTPTSGASFLEPHMSHSLNSLKRVI